MMVRNSENDRGIEEAAVKLPLQMPKNLSHLLSLNEEDQLAVYLALQKNLGVKSSELDIVDAEYEVVNDFDDLGWRLLMNWGLPGILGVSVASLCYHAAIAAKPVALATGKIAGEGAAYIFVTLVLGGLVYLFILMLGKAKKSVKRGEFDPFFEPDGNTTDRRSNNVNFNINFDQKNY